MREEFTFGGLTGVTAFDGKTGWKIEPWAGKKDAEPLGEDETKGIVEDAEFDDPLFNYKERGNTVSLVGTDQIEGTDVYKLMVTLASNGDVRTYYLDAESCVPIKYEVKRTVRGAERWFEVELGDYKEVQGVLFPFSVAIGAKGSSSADKQQYVVGAHHGEPGARRAPVHAARARREGRVRRRTSSSRARRVRAPRRFPRRHRVGPAARATDVTVDRRLGDHRPDSARATSGRLRCRVASRRSPPCTRAIVSRSTSARRAAACGSR